MPNYDAGHYFLTVLAPVRADPFLVADRPQSRRHALRDALTAMPNGERTAATQQTAPNNPFARTDFTHFARFFVLDDVVYNGRAPRDGIVATVLKASPLTPQKIDRLATPFLVFVADFDVAGGTDADLDDRLSRLWNTMQIELTSLFQHCVGFAGVTDAAGFCTYMRRCQVVTTMPFNDYWSAPPPQPVFGTKPYIYAGSAAAAVLCLGLFVWRPWLLLLSILGLGAIVVMAYQKLMAAAARPFPVSAQPAPGADLPTVLKALTVQRGFTQFAIAAQGKSDHDLSSAFGEFIATAKPDDMAAATQIPGVIGV